MDVARVAITGGTRGIGLATAQACVRAGMSVAIGARSGTQSAAIAEQLGDRAVGFGLDVRNGEQFEAFLARSEEHIGPLDALINNAGIVYIGSFVHEDPADTQRSLDINLSGVMTGTRLALRRFLPRGHGHIVNMASAGGQVALAGEATYAATKHAVVGFTRAIRAETRGTGVRTTIVMPGFTRTEMSGGLETQRGMRFVSPDAVADAIVTALRTGREELYVPRELGTVARLVAGTPPWIADRIKRAFGLDDILFRAGADARRGYLRSVERLS
ncbi:SDR family NAD(P)-dependent oxidoreductase [Mycobacterium montefiorense]|uniref:Short-chain dehydrogenase/reductase n=1 Tax=Mycobacterium montefiorense TaxID=154654 RepID=A0AA37PNQ5_9MYCO|nr:SDR family NAD(P)-dependent oxidoreductase [Mycobacterium montefiorense]GBG40802.1 putative short-chain dehydrogenase/reductase [Mycobacterium montefiorense]GKU36334.1 putative short-chain dehydrogenase/reductase [Mycobacterium montefiorense]GKU41855.1 putative short-chain dehydrogenase/reductase [Mycobacterium montefiorense]GKU47749.1 putative short-chain dehydrogenase/reductase [Mycobacterium montefiorense]GKU52827.1 putative short-chain dehydrogenase/reductase [Mycobacterium montefiorens